MIKSASEMTLNVSWFDNTPVTHKQGKWPRLDLASLGHTINDHINKIPEGAYAQAITQVVGIVTACSLLVVYPSQTIILPSCGRGGEKE